MSLDESATPSLPSEETGSLARDDVADHHTKKDHDTVAEERPQHESTRLSAKDPVSIDSETSALDGVKDMEAEKPLYLSPTEASVKDQLALSTASTQEPSGKELHVKQVMKDALPSATCGITRVTVIAVHTCVERRKRKRKREA